MIAAGYAAVVVASATLGHAAKAHVGEPPNTIHSMPLLMPHHDYSDHLDKLHHEAFENMEGYSEKLVTENKKLRRRVAAMESELGREHSMEVASEIDAVTATHGEYAKESIRAVGLAVTLLMLTIIILGTLVTFLAGQRHTTVVAKTWRTLEKVLIIFVIVMWFQVLDNVFHWIGVTLHMEAALSVVHASVVFVVLVALSVKASTRNDDGRTMEIISAWGVHYFSFMIVHAGGHVQEAFFSKYLWLAFLGIPLFFVFCAGVSALTRWILMKRLHDEDNEHFVDKIEELEDDANGMMLAFLVTMLVRFVISGEFDGHMDGETGAHVGHSWVSRLVLFLYGCAMVALTVYLVPKLHHLGLKLQDALGGHLAQRVLLILNPFLCMSITWSFILWADWEFYEHLYRGQPVLGRIAWASVCSFVSFLAVWLYAKHSHREPIEDGSGQGRTLDLAWRWHDLERRKNVLNAIAALVAFAWAQVLGAAVADATSSSLHPLIGQFVLAVLVTLIGYFIYVRYVMPTVLAAQDFEEPFESKRP